MYMMYIHTCGTVKITEYNDIFIHVENSQSATNHRSVAPWKQQISDLSWYN